MRNIFFLAIILITNQALAQNEITLESIIPKDAGMVVRMNGKALTQKVGMKNIAKSEAFLKLLEGEIFLGNDKKRVTEIGVNLEKDVFMIHKLNQDISYTAYLYHIEKPKLFAKYISEKNDFVETEKGTNYTVIFYKSTSYYSEEQDFLAWNNEYAIYVDVNHVRDSPVRNVAEPIEAEMLQHEIEQSYYEEEAEDAVDAAYEEQTTEYYQELEAQRVAQQKTKDSLIEVKRLEEIAIIRGIYATELNHFFGERSDTNTILKNANYLKSRNVDADLSFWMNLRGNSYVPISLYNYGYYGRRNDLPGIISMYLGAYAGKVLNAHLFFNQKDITVKSNIEFMPEIGALLEGIYGSSIPKSYLKYINTEKVMSISSASVNATKFWEAFPSIFADGMMLGSRHHPNEKEQAGIRTFVDFVSILVDEEALSKLMTGSAVFVLKDLVPTEVEYFSYEYNEDYSESKRVKKTKTEVYPDILLMFGSENKEFMTKLLELACKNEVLYRKGNYYYSDGSSRDFPFALYFTITKDMAFISTNANEIQNLAEGKSTGNLDKKMASNILKNSSYFNLNLPDLLNRIPKEQMSSEELKMLTYFTDNGGEIEWFNNYNDNRSEGRMQMNTPSKFKNSALFVWDLLETVHEMEIEERKAVKEAEEAVPNVEEEYNREEMKCEEGKCEGGH